MNRIDLKVKQPIGAQVVFNTLLAALIMAVLGVVYVGMSMRNRGHTKEVKQVEKEIDTLQAEICRLTVDLEQLESQPEMGRLLMELTAKQIGFRRFAEDEVVTLAEPKPLK
jgi:cell division protein FtsL